MLVGVKSLCIEEDCTDQSVKVVNQTTGECMTCFPCLICSDGVPSVPCGSTVPHGTDIHCVQLPDPALVSKSSAYATSGILTSLVASPSVTLWSSSLTRMKQNSVVPETRNAHLVIVPATSSKISSGFSSSAVNVGSKETSNYRKKRKLHQEENQKMGDNMKFSLISGAALIVTVVGIVYVLWKRKTTQSHPPTSSAIADTDPTVWKTNTCTVHPATVTAVHSCACPEDDKDKEEKGNQRFQSNSVYADSCEEISETIPLSLDVVNPEGKFPNLNNIPDILFSGWAGKCVGLLGILYSNPRTQQAVIGRWQPAFMDSYYSEDSQ